MAEHLEILRIGRLPEWDVLSYIYRHGASLASAQRIADPLGYSRAVVGAALDSLTSSGILHRSRNSRGVRLYRLTETIPDISRFSLEKLMKVAEGRVGRLLIVSHFRQAAPGNERRERGGLHLA